MNSPLSMQNFWFKSGRQCICTGRTSNGSSADIVQIKLVCSISMSQTLVFCVWTLRFGKDADVMNAEESAAENSSEVQLLKAGKMIC